MYTKEEIESAKDILNITNRTKELYADLCIAGLNPVENNKQITEIRDELIQITTTSIEERKKINFPSSEEEKFLEYLTTWKERNL